jgi:ribosomal-protein-alanine N-acetyltransferase
MRMPESEIAKLSSPQAFLQLVPLTADWLDGAMELDRLCFGGLWSLDGYRREIDSPNSDLWIWLDGEGQDARAAGIGCLWAIVDEAHITLIGIHPNYRRRGLGEAMVFALLRSAWQRGMARATLEVRASNRAALSLYEKFGFQIAGRRRRYYADTGEDALILWRSRLQFREFEQALPMWETAVGDRLGASGLKLSLADD